MIDWDRVSELREEVGSDDFIEVAAMFLSEVEDVLSRLRTGLNVGTLEGDMHFLKGAALNIGFAEFAAFCRDGEARAAASDFASIDIPKIAACFDASKQALVRGLAETMEG